MGGKGLRCLLLVLLAFAGTYGVLVGAYRMGTVATIGAGILFLILGIGLLFASIDDSDAKVRITPIRKIYCGIFSGLFLWAVLGEVIGNLGVIEIAGWRMFPLLALFTLLVVLFGVKRYLPSGLLFCLAHFNAIWFLHLTMVSQFELMGRTSWVTYPSCALFLFLAALSGYRMTRSRTDAQNMAYAMGLLLTGWTVLEYIWGWRLLPGPWMLTE